MPDDATTQKIAGPPVVYLPVELDDQGQVSRVKLARMADGRVALLGYTALDRFMRCCGAAHPWMLFDCSQLEALRQTTPYDVNYLDVPLPVELRQEAS